MDYTTLGSTGLEISRIGYGTFYFNKSLSSDVISKLLKTAYEEGINYIDTANDYNNGLSEKVIGTWIKEQNIREEIILSTKFGWPTGKSANEKGWSKKHIKHAIEGSLKRLQTNYVDLYLPHGITSYTNIKEILGQLHFLQQQDIVLYSGIFVSPPWKIVEAYWIAKQYHWDDFRMLQIPYSLVARGAVELDFKNIINSYKIPFTAFAVQGAGFLAGKYLKPQDFGDSDRDKWLQANYAPKKGWELLETVRRIAEEHGVNSGQVAIKWVLDQEFVTNVIIGASTQQQIIEASNIWDINLSSENKKDLLKKSEHSLRRLFELG